MADQKAKIILEAQDNASASIGKIQGTLNTLRNFIVGSKIFEFLRDTIKGSVTAAIEQEIALNKLDAVLKSTGNAVGLTRDQILSLNDQLSKSTGIQDEVILSGQDMLLTFKNLRGEAFEKATRAMVDMDTVMSNGASTAESMNGTAIRLGKALNDPIAGLGALSRVGVQFTDVQKEQINQMVKAGNVAGAQAVILKELDSQFGGAAETIGNSFAGALKKAQVRVDEVKEAIGQRLAPIIVAASSTFALFFENIDRSFKDTGAATFFAKTVSLAIDQVGRQLDLFLFQISSVGDRWEQAKLTSERALLKIKGLFTDQGKALAENNSKLTKIDQDYYNGVEKIEDSHYKNRQKILSLFSTQAKSVQSGIEVHHDKSTKNIVKKEQKTQDEIREAHWYTKSFREKLDNEFDAGQIQLMKNRIEREKLGFDESMALMQAYILNSGLSAEAVGKIDQMMLDKQMEHERKREEENKRVNDQLVSFSQDLSDAIAGEEENKIKAIANVLKRYLNSQVDAWIAAEIAKATASAFAAVVPTFGGSLVALGGQLAAITGAAAVAKTAINAVKFHDGGIVGQSGGSLSESTIRSNEVPAKLMRGEMVLTESDQKRLLGIIRGGGGQQSGPIQINLMLDKKVLGRAIYELDAKRRTGTL